MTLPFPVDPPERRKANWLGRYLSVEGKFDSRLKTVLSQATTDISDAFGDLREDLFSAKVRRAQIVQSHRSIRGIINGLFGDEADLIREHRQDAAMAAVDASLYDQRGILSSVFNPNELSQYAKSLEQQAARNIDAVMTRVLETEKPLSARVYDTRSLAQGVVNRQINKTLATGGSARDLAKSVTALIDPTVPGGVSYAARRLGVTELNNAFHAQSIHDAQEVPWIERMKWNLSKVHESDPGDECEEYANIEYFPVEKIPEKPHPHCRCYVVSIQPDRESFVQAVDSGQYDNYLDQWLNGDAPVEPPKFSAEPSIDLSTKTIDKMSHDELNTFMASRYPEIAIDGLDATHTEIEPARQIIRATDEMLTKYPNQGLTSIGFRRLEDTVDQAHAHVIDLGNGKSRMEFNTLLTLDPDEAERRMQNSYAKGLRVKGIDGQPFYTNAIHEFGHILDFNGQQFAHGGITENLEAVYKQEKKVKVVDPQRYYGWLIGRSEKVFKGAAPSKYAMSGGLGGSVSELEILAEGFQDVEINKSKAKATSKAMHRLLIRSRSGYAESPVSKGKRIKGFQIKDVYDPEIREAKTHSDIVKIITKRYPTLVINNLDRVPLPAAKEIADAIEDNVFYHKKGKLKYIDIEDFTEKKNAEGRTDPPDSHGNIRMTLNSLMIRDPEVYASTVLRHKTSGHNRAWDETRPYYSLFTHEFGHTIDFTGQGNARPKVVDVMMNTYAKLVEPEVFGKGNSAWQARAKEWLIENGPSTYGWKDGLDGKFINPTEMLPEAYVDAMLNQDKAQEVSKWLTGQLLQAYKDEVGE